ncbi:hypothetical protein KXD40_004514 [Peronospora effusa]|nr:hypothetical protein KXD40_004514 [Peronospora effusa]
MNLELGLAPSSGNALEEFTTGARAGKNANNLPGSAALATNDGVGEIKKILDEGVSVIEAAKIETNTYAAAEKLKESLALKWSDEMMVRLEKMLLAGKKDKYFSEQILFKWFNAAETPQGKIHASSLKQLLQSNMGDDWLRHSVATVSAEQRAD